MEVIAFLSFFDKVDGESIQRGKEKWVEIHSWEWAVDAETSWTKGGGASVGKPVPGKLHFEHPYDTSSPVILGYICTGKAFPKVQLDMMRSTRGSPDTYFTMTMEGVFITRVSNASTAEGSVVQRVEMVFKTVKIEYRPQDKRTGAQGVPSTFQWDIHAGTASPTS